MLNQIEVIVNGERRPIPVHWSVEDLMDSLQGTIRGPVAVELNEDILRRENWASTPLKKGDRLEVVHFVGGGA